MNPLKNSRKSIPDPLLAKASEWISEHMGLYFPEARRNDLDRGLRTAAREFGFEDPEECVAWLISGPAEKDRIEVLAGFLTVGETYFFRDKRCFDFLEEKVLPGLIEGRRSAGKYLRIWSAGCCTGEEPFSVAILLAKLLPDIKDWSIMILATDVNPAFIRKGVAGIYGEWSFRDAPKGIKQKYFTGTKENRYVLNPVIRKSVSFACHNLAGNDYPSARNLTSDMDLILCRNVLMYSASDHQRNVTRRLGRCLVQGGWLIVGPSEASDPLFPDLTGVSFQGARFYRKSQETSRAGVRSAREQRKSGVPEPERPMEKNIPPRRLPTMPLRHSIESPPRKGKMAEERPRAVQDPHEEALALYNKGLYREAAERAMPLLLDKLREAGAAALLARIHADQGKLSEAAAFCRRAVAADRCNPGHYYLLATILQEQGLLQEAASALRNTLYLDRDFVLAHFLLGSLALRNGSRKESTRHFRNALKLLGGRPSEELIPGAGGLTAGRLIEIIKSSAPEGIR